MAVLNPAQALEAAERSAVGVPGKVRITKRIGIKTQALCYTFDNAERLNKMLHQVNYNDPKVRLRDLIDAVLRGDKVVIVAQGGKQILELVPAKRSGQRKFGSAKGKIKMAKDFDHPLADFNAYMS
jgi:antitoxin (DNA-binding transcriptional repressor) of toxin-antitoxin stability system